MSRPTLLALGAALVAAAALGGCAASSYYWQAFSGQMEVKRLSRPVDEVIAAPDTNAELRQRLEYARQARDFASHSLGLPDNRSYRVYADLKRSAVVWNVFAAPELSLKLQTHCFPVAGCVSYRGYFAEADANAYAQELRDKGYDVYSGGVPAYSTLGWFDDPLLNTFIRYPELELARLIFHELGHQVAYAPGDSTFNESFATTVEEEGLRRWMVAHATPEQKTRYDTFVLRRKDLMDMLRNTRDKLDLLYKRDIPDPEKLAGKRAIFAAMRDEYNQLKQTRWGGYSGYDVWITRDLNNAKLGSISTYNQLIPAFTALLHQQGDDLPRFYEKVKELAKLPKAQRDEQLKALAPAAFENTAADPAATASR